MKNSLLARQLGNYLQINHLTITTAESCTGGGLAYAITSVAGSSVWFESSIVTYSNQAKQQYLNVSESLLIEHGAVSEPVVKAMACGAIDLSGANIAIAVSGVAGPDGGTTEKPVGTVCFAWFIANTCLTSTCHFSGNREAVREQCIQHALSNLLIELAC